MCSDPLSPTPLELKEKRSSYGQLGEDEEWTRELHALTYLYLSFHLQVNCAFAFPFNEFYSGKFLFLQSPVLCIKYNKEYKNHYYAWPVNK